MPRPSALSLSLCLLAACAAPSGGGDPLEGVPAEDYRPEAARAELQVGQLLVQCDTKLTAWQKAMGAERDLENLEQIDFTERAIATLVRQNKEELKRLTVAGEPRSRAIATAALAFAFLPRRQAGILSCLAASGLLLEVGGWWATRLTAQAAPLVPLGALCFGAGLLLALLGLLQRCLLPVTPP